MEKYESFEDLKNSDTESSKDGKVKHEESLKKFFELLRENVVKRCELCERHKELTFHHLIPQINHSKNKFLRLFTKEEMRTRGIDICKDCHSTIHRLIDNKTLGLEYNTKEKLMAHEGISKFVEWAKKQNKKIKK